MTVQESLMSCSRTAMIFKETGYVTIFKSRILDSGKPNETMAHAEGKIIDDLTNPIESIEIINE